MSGNIKRSEGCLSKPKRMSFNASRIIPNAPIFPLPNQVFESCKWSLIYFIFLGALGILLSALHEEISNKRLWSNSTECKDKSNEIKLKDIKLNAELLEGQDYSTDPKLLNKLKKDIERLKGEVLKMTKKQKLPACTVEDLDKKIKSLIGDSNTIDHKIRQALDTYDADKLALYDYAAEYAGGEIVKIIDTVPFPTGRIGGILGYFTLTYSSSPDEIIKPSTIPGNCFKFYGSRARIIIRLGKTINVGSVSMEHSTVVEDLSDAPKEFTVSGLPYATAKNARLLGSFTYKIKGIEPLQNFPIPTPLFAENSYEYIVLEILSNHGNPDFTSIYRFRVHSG